MGKRKEKTSVQRSIETRAKRMMAKFGGDGNDVHPDEDRGMNIENQDRGIDDGSDEFTNHHDVFDEYQVPSDDINQPSEVAPPPRRRGPTKCKVIATRVNERLAVQLNDRGQPVKQNSVTLSSYRGALAREIVPLGFKEWEDVPEYLKAKLWFLVKQKFIVPEDIKKTTLERMNKSWRDYKSRLRVTHIDECANVQEAIKACPDDIKLEDWKQFIKNEFNPKQFERRKQFKILRQFNQTTHTCGRRGYARLKDDMKCSSDDTREITDVDVWTKAHIKKNGEPVNDYVKGKIGEITEQHLLGHEVTLTQVLGPNRRGRVRGVGFGVTPSTLLGADQKSAKVQGLEEEVDILRSEVKSMKEIVEKCIAVQINKPVDEQPQCVDGSPQVQNNLISHKEGSNNTKTRVRCTLVRLVPEDVVAKGYWVTDDPKAIVHGLPLGQGMSKVCIEVPVQEDALLVRKNSELKTIGDAVGTFVAWPTQSVLKE